MLLLAAVVIVLPLVAAIAIIGPRRFRAPVVAAVVGVACLFGCVLGFGEQLVGQDYAQITVPGLIEMPVWPKSGRFFPMAFQEFNLLHMMSATVTADYAFVALQVALLILGLWYLLDDVRPGIRAIVIGIILLTPGVLMAMQGLIYPERPLLVCLPLLLLALRKAGEKPEPLVIACAAVVVLYVLLLKETAFLLVGGIAGARLIARLGRGWSKDALRTERLSLLSLGLCLAFILTYAIGISPHVAESYAPRSHVVAARVAAAQGIFTGSPVLIISAALFATRLIGVVRGQEDFDLAWDSAMVGGIAFSLGYVALGMHRPHYLAPADLVAIAYLGRRIELAFFHRPQSVRTGAIGVLAASSLLVLGDLHVDVRYLSERRAFAAANADLARTIATRLEGGRASALFFPHVGGFQVMEFAAFLRHSGISVTTSEHAGRVTLKTPHKFPDDRCFPSQAFQCAYAKEPSAGDLIVVLPGHDGSGISVRGN